ncbi:MAG: hypothetical protein HY695_33360 [Deltaproteobacteria bacterium]|nr:hypothetical protein [Deltaproteobacteria bacterium]
MKTVSVLIIVLAVMVWTSPAMPAGFDEFGYNRTARVFVGTGWSWCMGKGIGEAWCEWYLGPYANDHLVMKWNKEWDRGNEEGWSKPPYDAWTDNEWNGAVPDGSGSVWHYKFVWFGSCGKDYTPLPNGGYCIWGEFETIMDHGVDLNYGPGHYFLGKAQPNGYGYYPLFP